MSKTKDISDAHAYEKLPTTADGEGVGDSGGGVRKATTGTGVGSSVGWVAMLQAQWRWVLLSAILVVWVAFILFLMPVLWPTVVKREGYNLVYWTPHKTGSTSMRTWLRRVAERLESEIAVIPKYPNKPTEDHHKRFKRMGLKQCAFLAGHIRINSVWTRENELKLGSVISTIRDPRALFASKYFHRTRRKLHDHDLKAFRDPTSQKSRLWFFYFNDLDPCEQLRYYDGLRGCNLAKVPNRVRAIADRIDCIVDTDDVAPDLAALCRQMGLNDDECPEMPFQNVKNKHNLYDDLFAIPHIRDVMNRTLQVTDVLREHFLHRRCRFLGPGGLITPHAEPPQWPYKGCTVESTLEVDDPEDDAPENDPDVDDAVEVDDGDDNGDNGDNGTDGTGNADEKSSDANKQPAPDADDGADGGETTSA